MYSLKKIKHIYMYTKLRRYYLIFERKYQVFKKYIYQRSDTLSIETQTLIFFSHNQRKVINRNKNHLLQR